MKSFKIKFIDSEYTVKFVDVKIDDEEILMGKTENDKNLIVICTTANKNRKQLENTLLHEVIHVLFYQTGWSDILKNEEGLVKIRNVFSRRSGNCHSFFHSPEFDAFLYSLVS